MGTRDRIIDALQDVLESEGPRGATLEAVAARAGISKGGLLYHFNSKEALYGGLLERLAALGAQDVQRGIADAQGPVAGYLRSSSIVHDEYTATVLAALRLVGTRDVDVETSLAASFAQWDPVLTSAVDDPVLARLVQLVGDGLYLRALFGEPYSDLDEQVVARLVDVTRGRDSGVRACADPPEGE